MSLPLLFQLFTMLKRLFICHLCYLLSCVNVVAIETYTDYDKPLDNETIENLIQQVEPRSQINDIALSPNDEWLALGSAHGTIHLWGIRGEKREIKRLEGHIGAVSSVAVSPDGKQLASSGFVDKIIYIWEVASGKKIKRLKGHTKFVVSVVFSPDGRYLASGAHDHKIIVWDIETGEKVSTLKWHKDGITNIAFSNNGNWLASASWDTKAVIWNWKTEEVVKVFSHPDSVFNVAFSPNSRWLVSGADDSLVRLWDTQTDSQSQPIIEFIEHKSWISSVAFSPNGQLLISSSGNNTVHIHDFQQRKILHSFKIYHSWISKAIFSHDGQFIVINAGNGSMRLYDVQSEKLQYLLITGQQKENWLSCDVLNSSCLRSKPFTNETNFLILISFISLLTLGLISYILIIYRHPLVIMLSTDANKLLTFPLPQLVKVKKLLTRAHCLNTVLSNCQIPLAVFDIAITFPQISPVEQVAFLAKRLSINNNKKLAHNLFTLHLPEDFPLNLKSCMLYFPESDMSLETILTELEKLKRNDEWWLPNIIVISLNILQQNKLRPHGEDTNTLWIVPNNSELTQWLLAPEPIKVFAKVIATQLKLTKISPYQTHGGVSKDILFFGRTHILSQMLNRNQSNYLIVGGRKIGKTSLLKYLERYYQNNSDIVCHFFSLKTDGKLLKNLVEHLPLPANSNLEDVSHYLINSKQLHLFLIDEVDKFIQIEMQQNYPTLTYFRSLSEEGHCYFILAGFWELYRAAVLDYHAPLKNFGEIITLGELEKDACHDLIVKPLEWLNITIASEALIEKIINATGQRANLIAIACNEILKHLDSSKRVVDKTNVENALHSNQVYDDIEGWENLAYDKHEVHLDSLIIYTTVQAGEFTLSSILKILKKHDRSCSLEQVKQSLNRLALAFVIRNQRQYYTYCVPLFRERLLQEDVDELLKWI